MNCLAPPPIDPARARHIEAFDALIDRRLRAATGRQRALAARRLLVGLCDDGLATLTTDPRTGAHRLTLLGVTSDPTHQPAAAILRLWQHAARDRLATNP